MCPRAQVALLLTCEYLSIVLDESTTCNMDGQPCLVCLMGLADDGEWVMVYIGQTNMAKQRTAQDVYDAAKKVVVDLDPRLWPLIRCGGTDGCAAMRSSNHYAGIDGNRKKDADNFMSIFTREFTARKKAAAAAAAQPAAASVGDADEANLGPEPEPDPDPDPGEPGPDADTLAMHCLLHMLALGVLDAVDELPPWFIKFVQKITTFFKTSCKRYTEFKELIKKAFEDFLVDNPHPEKDEKLRYKMYYFTSRAAPHPPGCVPVPPVLQVLSVWLALLLLTRVRLRA